MGTIITHRCDRCKATVDNIHNISTNLMIGETVKIVGVVHLISNGRNFELCEDCRIYLRQILSPAFDDFFRGYIDETE